MLTKSGGVSVLSGVGAIIYVLAFAVFHEDERMSMYYYVSSVDGMISMINDKYYYLFFPCFSSAIEVSKRKKESANKGSSSLLSVECRQSSSLSQLSQSRQLVAGSAALYLRLLFHC